MNAWERYNLYICQTLLLRFPITFVRACLYVCMVVVLIFHPRFSIIMIIRIDDADGKQEIATSEHLFHSNSHIEIIISIRFYFESFNMEYFNFF